MTAYGKPYTVRGWGDEVVTTVDIDESVEGYTHVVRAVPGPVILVPTVSLTPVDTTPAEPEPGAWLIGEKLCMTDGAGRWLFTAVGGYGVKPTWDELWAYLGGPDVPIVRLVPAPAPVEQAELPWKYCDSTGDTFELDVDSDGAFVVARDRNGSNTNVIYLPADELAAAARAAREATS